MTFILCRDNDNELNYLKKLAAEEKNDYRQEYILYTQSPRAEKFKELYTDPKYARFRFLSNSWKAIERYILGAYQKYAGIANKEIYRDELIHVFYDERDSNLVNYYKSLKT